VAADMPQANRLAIGIMSVMAQHEREMISTRTKAAKRRGVKLGGDRGYVITAKARAAGKTARRAKAQARASDLAPVVKELQAAGCESLRAIAAGLEERGIPAPRCGKWSALQAARLLGAARRLSAEAYRLRNRVLLTSLTRAQATRPLANGTGGRGIEARCAYGA